MIPNRTLLLVIYLCSYLPERASAFRSSSLLHRDRDRRKTALGLYNAAERLLGVVIEQTPPALARGFGQQLLLCCQRLRRIEIETHDPGERNVSARGNDVGKSE